MTSFQLDSYLAGNVYAFVMVYTRVVAFFIYIPGLAESYVSPRIRMMFALAVSFLLLNPVMHYLPPMPNDLSRMVAYLGFEAMVGLFMGTLVRFLIATLETTGSIITLMTGLSNAMVFNPVQAAQSPLPSALLGVLATTLVFVSGLEYMLIKGIVASYNVFTPGGTIIPGDMLQVIARTISASFVMGVQLAMPFFVVGLLAYLALGLMQKVLHGIQIFMIAVPVQIWGGMFLLGLTVSGVMAVWLRYFDANFNSFLSM